MATNYKVINGKIIKVVEEDVTNELKGGLDKFNQAFETAKPKLQRREQLQKAIDAYAVEISKIDNEIKVSLQGFDKEFIKQIEPEKAEKLGF